MAALTHTHNRRRSSTQRRIRPSPLTPAARRCREHFLAFFPDGFRDESYVQTERSYKWHAHREWVELLNRKTFESLLDVQSYDEIARRALRIESRTNLLFSFEKMALRDALRHPVGARTFATGLHRWIYGSDRERERFERWTEQVAALPRRQTRVLTWPIGTGFG